MELSFLGVEADALVLADGNGTRYTLPVTDELRHAVKQTPRTPSEQVRTVSPKDIQQMLRAGASVEEVSDVSDLPVEHVRRYEGPVQAEKDWTVQQAQSFAVGHQPDSPSLGDLVVDRLATRQVTRVEWNATREGSEPWHVTAAYHVADTNAVATWEVDLATRSVRALDDEARWLSETDASSPRARRHLGSALLYDVDDDGAVTPAQEDETDVLLTQLHENRGRRSEDLLSGFLDEPEDIPAAHPRPSQAQEATDARILPMPTRAAEPAPAEASAAPAPAPAEKKSRRGRRSVPSWDEIVFGSHQD